MVKLFLLQYSQVEVLDVSLGIFIVILHAVLDYRISSNELRGAHRILAL